MCWLMHVVGNAAMCLMLCLLSSVSCLHCSTDTLPLGRVSQGRGAWGLSSCTCSCVAAFVSLWAVIACCCSDIHGPSDPARTCCIWVHAALQSSVEVSARARTLQKVLASAVTAGAVGQFFNAIICSSAASLR
jgi:hypothetical protein